MSKLWNAVLVATVLTNSACRTAAGNADSQTRDIAVRDDNARSGHIFTPPAGGIADLWTGLNCAGPTPGCAASRQPDDLGCVAEGPGNVVIRSLNEPNNCINGSQVRDEICRDHRAEAAGFSFACFQRIGADPLAAPSGSTERAPSPVGRCDGPRPACSAESVPGDNGCAVSGLGIAYRQNSGANNCVNAVAVLDQVCRAHAGQEMNFLMTCFTAR